MTVETNYIHTIRDGALGGRLRCKCGAMFDSYEDADTHLDAFPVAVEFRATRTATKVRIFRFAGSVEARRFLDRNTVIVERIYYSTSETTAEALDRHCPTCQCSV